MVTTQELTVLKRYLDRMSRGYLRKSCQLHQTMPVKAPAHPWEKTKAPWIRMQLEFSGLFLDKIFYLVVFVFEMDRSLFHIKHYT